MLLQIRKHTGLAPIPTQTKFSNLQWLHIIIAFSQKLFKTILGLWFLVPKSKQQNVIQFSEKKPNRFFLRILKAHMISQARSQDLEKGGAILKEWEVCKRLESVSDGLSEIWDEMSRKARKFKGFFRPKLGDLQKKKKKKKKKVFAKIQSDFSAKIRWSPKKKKKRSSPKFRAIFLPISQVQTFEGGSFRMGGAIFHFSHKIGLKITKNMRFCILHKPMGGLEPPPAPPPGYATVISSRNHCTMYTGNKLLFPYSVEHCHH